MFLYICIGNLWNGRYAQFFYFYAIPSSLLFDKVSLSQKVTERLGRQISYIKHVVKLVNSCYCDTGFKMGDILSNIQTIDISSIQLDYLPLIYLLFKVSQYAIHRNRGIPYNQIPVTYIREKTEDLLATSQFINIQVTQWK